MSIQKTTTPPLFLIILMTVTFSPCKACLFGKKIEDENELSYLRPAAVAQ
jgi:hypothetical protein